MAGIIEKENPVPACNRCKLVAAEAMYSFDKRPCGCPDYMAPDWVMILEGQVFKRLFDINGFCFGVSSDYLGTRKELGL